MAAQAILAFGSYTSDGAILFAQLVGIVKPWDLSCRASSMLLGGRCHSGGNAVTFYLRNGYSQCTQFLHRVHELAIAFYPAVLEFEGMDVVVLAIALRIPGPAPCRARRTRPRSGSDPRSRIRTLCHSQSGKQRSSHSASRLRLSWPRKTRGSPLSVVSYRRSRPRRTGCAAVTVRPLHGHVALHRGAIQAPQTLDVEGCFLYR